MTTRGLFIGIDRFSDSNTRELSGCQRDATALCALFKDTIENFDDILLINEKATTVTVKEAIDSVLIKATADDTVVISFSTHGTHDHRIAMYDTSPSNLDRSTISMQELADAFKKTQARAVLCILDCCFSGAAPARIMENSPYTRSFISPLDGICGNGKILIAACGTNEGALEHARHGLLTYALMEALQAPSSQICLLSIMGDVIQRVRAEAARQGHKQTPVLLGYLEGGLVFPSLRKGERFYKAFPECQNPRISSKIKDLTIFDFPDKLLNIWEDLFPEGLNELQVQAINDHHVLSGKSLLVIAPTSSGKTFIGELASARAIFSGKKVAFVFPYKALTNEKFDYFSRVYGADLGIRVIRCTGDYLDQTAVFIQGKYDLALLTYEMYLTLTVGTPATLSLLGLLVIDEAQFMTDRDRGITLELLLTNTLAARSRGLDVQIVALSAVIGDTNSFDEWIGASKLMLTTRPVPLVEGVIDRTGIFKFVGTDGLHQEKQLLPRQEIIQRREKASAQDLIIPFVKKLLAEDKKKRIIIFRNARGSAEGCAKYLATNCGFEPATEVINMLPINDPSMASETLRQCLQGGVAFHTSNLSREERELIERSFREKDTKLQILVATTTIAAGVNTPASTVIIVEQEFIGEENRFFTVAEYRNMAGRAGRSGYHEVGQSFLLADSIANRENLFQRYILGKLEPLKSSFIETEFETWVLRLLSQVKQVPKTDIIQLLASTYGSYIAAKANPSWHMHMEERISDVLLRMADLGLIEEEMGYIQLTLLGRACGSSFLSFRSTIRLISTLRSIKPPITPELLMIIVQVLPELDRVYTPITKKGQAEKEWSKQFHRTYGPEATQHLQKQVGDEWVYYARCKRVMILRDWINGIPMETIEQKATKGIYNKVGAGDIRNFADSTRYHLRAAAALTNLIFPADSPDANEVETFLKRLEFGLPTVALEHLKLPPILTRGEYLFLVAPKSIQSKI